MTDLSKSSGYLSMFDSEAFDSADLLSLEIRTTETPLIDKVNDGEVNLQPPLLWLLLSYCITFPSSP